MRFFILLMSICMLSLSGCVKNNPLPVWLEINEWTLQANPTLPNNAEGVLTHNFSNVWVYIDGKVIGVFEVPCKIPVLVSGTCEITLFPTILNNGLAQSKKIYPFVQPHVEKLELVEGETYTINPITKYYDQTVFWIEDFQNSEMKFEEDNTLATASMAVANDPNIAQWGYYGHVKLTPSNNIWVSLSSQMTLPKAGAEVYLELNYRNSCRFLYGLRAISLSNQNDNPLVFMNPTNGIWKKMYIDLKETVSYSADAYNFKHFFSVTLPDDMSEADIYIDNIKVVYLQ